jgi:peptidoglycan hydrolase-like protein with peptidoglycan-binding domain
MSGPDVSALQTFLAADATLYPQGLVTGYYGFLTKAAVSNFQARNNIPTVGRVGPMTLPVLNAQMAGGVSTGEAPIISSVGVSASSTTAAVSWNTNGLARGIVYYSTSPLTLNEHANSVDVSGTAAMTDTNLKTYQSVALMGLQANTTYYYLVYATNSAGNVSITWPTTFRTSN